MVKSINVRMPDGTVERYELRLLRVESYYEDDSPEDVVILKDDCVVELSDDETRNHFVTAYVHVGNVPQ